MEYHPPPPSPTITPDPSPRQASIADITSYLVISANINSVMGVPPNSDIPFKLMTKHLKKIPHKSFPKFLHIEIESYITDTEVLTCYRWGVSKKKEYIFDICSNVEGYYLIRGLLIGIGVKF